MNKFYLSITTWAGLCPGAVHYYGRIYSEWKRDKCAERDSWEVERNAKNPRGFRCQFDSREEVIKHAIKTFFAAKLHGILRIGDSSIYQPQHVLVCPKYVLEKAKQENRLRKKQEALYRVCGDDPWRAGRGKEMDAINDEWVKLWSKGG